MHIVYICIHIFFRGGGGERKVLMKKIYLTGQQQYPCFFT